MRIFFAAILLFITQALPAQQLDTAREWAIKVRCVMKGMETPVEKVDVQIHQVSNDSLVGADYTNLHGYTHFMVVKKGQDYYVHTSKAPYQNLNSYLFDLDKSKTGAILETILMEYPMAGGVDTAR